MRVIKIEQNTEEWLQFRLGKISGTKSKTVKPLSRGEDRTPQGIWQLLAEKVADNSGGESPIERGHRLEKEALTELATRLELDIDLEPGVWVSDLDEDIILSPDGAERADIPTWAAEAKCLSSANHLKYIVKDLVAKQSDAYNPINSIPNDYKDSFKEQVIDYFVVNEALKTLYFVLYDDRISPELGDWQFYLITVHRKDVSGLIKDQQQEQIDALAMVNYLIATLANNNPVADFGFKKPEKIKEGKDGVKTKALR